jgi:hypothetical protein
VVVDLSRSHLRSTMLEEHLGNISEMDLFEALISMNAGLD